MLSFRKYFKTEITNKCNLYLRKIKRRRIISDSSDNDTNLSQESNDAANPLVTIDEDMDIKIADEKKDDGEVEVDESLNSRRSGRIARNQDKMDEKKREQQKLEQELQVRKNEDSIDSSSFFFKEAFQRKRWK